MDAPSPARPTPLSEALQRAPTGAGPNAPSLSGAPPEELFCFKAGGLQLAVPSRHVREVIRVGPITPLPRVAPYILGVLGHRGEILPVVDLLRLLERGKSTLTDRTRLFVGVQDALTAAWVCDGTLGLRRVDGAELRAPPLGGGTALAQVAAIVPSAGQPGQGPLHVLNFARLIQAARERAFAR